ncbi:unnamed protein product [Cylindrotheca closterium]|uniref:Uncharacterized protein n=1 Tax=Cylindrotheca closterium TaxID=2856 RepID=A0AAD2CCY2_9STRA|nr:unnamed protein product [Cylindrotheca closterium]CAJ1957399.1 unnamed protein product [Cylindrotheca closterium]CAJ1965619.1 unnamed protein product [Cylindrotheca closterium]
MMQIKAQFSTIILGTLSFAGSSYVLYHVARSFYQYGCEGTLNLIWLGDPFPNSPILEYSKLVVVTESSLKKEENLLDEIESARQRAEAEVLDGGDKSTKRSLLLLWMRNYPELEKVLGEISHKLDKIAARVDGILLSNVDSSARKVQELRSKRKELSRKTVACMGRCDALMTLFKVLRDEK